MSAKTAPPHVVVIGAGVGGLATALRLSAAGLRVTVLERAPRPGGKMRQIRVGDDIFDGGPSVMTMPWVLDELLATVGRRAADVLPLSPLSPLCRHFFTDGTVLDLFADAAPPAGRAGSLRPADEEAAWAQSADEIARVISPRAAAQYRNFRRHAATIYRAVERPFLRRPLPRNPLRFFTTYDLPDVFGMLRLDAARSLWQALGKMFDDPRLRVLFARYATYSGADPFLAPATLAVITHVELAFGVYAVAGGMYSLAACLADLIERQGGRILCSADVERIELDEKGARPVAVHAGGERIAADYVVANCDAVQLYSRLLTGTRTADRHARGVADLPPSLSAYLNLFVVDGPSVAPLPLVHHNVFFSADYVREWEDLRHGPPRDPTVYLCNPDFGQSHQRWFCLTNSPPLPPPAAVHMSPPQPAAHLDSWDATRRAACRDRVVAKLAQHRVWPADALRAEADITPRDFADLFPHSRGAIYGPAASSRLGAFRRPNNCVPGIDHLYCVGGSTHPGAGVPMVMLSAAIVSDLLLQGLRARQVG